MNTSPLAFNDSFSVQQGQYRTTVTGDLRADNGSGADYDPDGTLMGYGAAGFSPYGDGGDYLYAGFDQSGEMYFLWLQRSGYVTFPVTHYSSWFTTANGGRVVLNTDGTFSYTAPDGFSGEDWFDYSLADGAFAMGTARVTINVLPTEGANDRPLAAADVFAGQEDVQITGNLLADNGNGADSDPDGDAMTVVNQTIQSARGGIVSIYANGDFVYRPPANYSGADSFTYTVKDEHGATSKATASLTLAAVNDAPLAGADSFTAVHDRQMAGNVLTNDRDVEQSALSATAGSFATAAGGTVSIEADGDFTYAPAAGFTGADTFTYRVTDADGASTMATATVTVINRAPTTTSDWFNAGFGKTASGVVTENDSDADGDALAVIAATLTTAQGGRVVLTADGSFTYSPSDAFYGTDSFTYQVRDTLGATTNGTATIVTAAPAGSIIGTSGVDSLTGTAAANTMFGGAGDDKLYGLDGRDTLAGGLDKDTLFGGLLGDKLYGQSGKDTLRGEAGADLLKGGDDGDDLYGGAGADWLEGGTGVDSLYGGGGGDKFVFAAPIAGEIDKIMDFDRADLIAVVGADFGLAAGSLPDASYFAENGAANAAHGRFLYNTANRVLSWDSDGDALTANLAIAAFDDKVVLTSADFLVI